MDRNRYARISDLFSRVCDLPPAEQGVRLREACADDPTLVAEVESLLAAEVKPVLRTPALGAGFSLTGSAGVDIAPEEIEPGPKRIGPYAIRRCISAGGMAVVYEAEQAHPHRVVALKVLRGGLMSRSALKRFQLEAEVLGRLEHPGIARIYDAGMHHDPGDPEGAPGVPYFAMELIDGVPITDYARAHGLDVRGRMELLAKVCDAVQHAHQHGIVHRDLKPANILVDATGQPRVLDFGVARATDSDIHATTLHTEAGQLVGTIPYMSPEQVLGDPGVVDTRSDVYALGVILYELLSGRLPYEVREAPIPEAARIIREQEPATLASADRSLRGDPATIAAKALEKDKARRYQSAAELGADLRRFLSDEPIVARPASTLYQLGKMARRNRSVFIALGIVMLTLVGATVVSAWMAVEADRARTRAVEALRESQGTSGYLLDLFLQSPDKPTINRIELLQRAERRLSENPPTEPRVEAKIREYIGHGWNKLNYLDIAEPHLVRALEIRRGLGVRDADMAQCLLLMAMQRLTQGRMAEGQDAIREALAIRRSLFAPDQVAGDPEGELMYFTTVYTPEEPEAVREFERRGLLREEKPAPIVATVDGPVVLEDEFDGDSLGPPWSVELLNSVGWTRTMEKSRLRVSDIEPKDRSSETEQIMPAVVRLCHVIEQPLGDFRVEAHIGWDSEGERGALQYVAVELFGRERVFIASVQYGDDWMRFGGARKAGIGTPGPSHHDVSSGGDSLPERGEADVAIERAGEGVTVSWDGHQLMRGVSSDPFAEVTIEFIWTVHSGVNGSSSFGSEWIDSIRVRGTPAPIAPPR